MNDPTALFTLVAAGTAAVAIAAAAGLRGWQEWLDLRRTELGGSGPRRSQATTELIELRARVRRLEAIASGAQN